VSTTRTRILLTFFFLVNGLCLAGASRANESSPVFWGEARDADGKLLYREKHVISHEGDNIRQSLTIYLDPEGREIARMVSEYDRSLMMPTYVFEDYRRNYREGLRFENGAYYIFKSDAKRGEVTKPLEESENVFSCQGWHYYLVRNLDKLERNEPLKLQLIFPNKLRHYSFLIEKVRADGENIRVKLKFANRLVSWFAPHLELVYDKKSQKLIEYSGVSNILDAKEELQEVFIRYLY